MKPALLIAVNLVREQRWIVLGVVAFTLGLATVVAWPTEQITGDQVQFYMGFQSVYAVGFATVGAAQASHNERKNRRILVVLSKAVGRRQYIAGLLLGVFASSALMMIALGVGASFMAMQISLPIGSAWEAVGLIWIASCLGAVVAMFCATLLHPLLALIATSGLIGLGPLLLRQLGHPSHDVIPVYTLLQAATEIAIGNRVPRISLTLFAASAEMIIFWLLAGWMFEKRDIAVAVE